MSTADKATLRRRPVKPESTSQTVVSELAASAVAQTVEPTQTFDDESSPAEVADATDGDGEGVDVDGSGVKRLTAKKHKAQLVAVGKQVIHEKPRMRKRKHTAIFLLGSLFGILAAGFFAKQNDLIDFPIGEITMESFLDVLPVSLVADMRDLVVCARAGAEGGHGSHGSDKGCVP